MASSRPLLTGWAGRRVALAVPAGLALLLLSPTGTAAAQTEHQRISGTTLTATSSTFLDSCTREDTYLTAFTSKDGPAVSYSSTTDNFCEDSYTQTYGTGPASLLKVTGDLSSGHLVAALPVATRVVTDGNVQGSSSSTLDIDETWTANGAVAKESYSGSQSVPGVYRYAYSSRSSARPADVAGALGLDSGYIQKSTTATLTVTHP